MSISFNHEDDDLIESMFASMPDVKIPDSENRREKKDKDIHKGKKHIANPTEKDIISFRMEAQAKRKREQEETARSLAKEDSSSEEEEMSKTKSLLKSAEKKRLHPDLENKINKVIAPNANAKKNKKQRKK